MTSLPPLMTLDAFLRLPEQKPALGLEDGRVIEKAATGARHSVLQATMMRRLAQSAEPRRLAIVFPELRASFGGNSYVLDIAVYRWDRVPRDADGRIADLDQLEPPDIAVEIAAPEHDVNMLVRRCLWYVDNGVRIALLLDPADRSVVRFRPGENPVVLTGDDVIAIDGVLDDFELTVQELFDSLRIR